MALVSQAEFARQQGFSRSYVTQLIKKGIVSLVDGKVDSIIAAKSLRTNSDPSKQTASKIQTDLISGQQGAVDFVTARTMREAFKAKLAKLEYEEKDGLLTDAAQVKQDAFKSGRIIRDELLTIPDRLADVLAAENDPREIRNRLVEELEQVLNHLCQ